MTSWGNANTFLLEEIKVLSYKINAHSQTNARSCVVIMVDESGVCWFGVREANLIFRHLFRIEVVSGGSKASNSGHIEECGG